MSVESAFPWYDSPWLQAYVRAKSIIGQVRPGILREFESTLSVLQAPADFRVKQIRKLLSPEQLERALGVVAGLGADDFERHELLQFGRMVVHDHPEFARLQRVLNARASELAGEELEPSYNFLSLYNNLGVCAPHMDAPSAKWTLDICLEQSEPWPISFSQPVPWPEDFRINSNQWRDQVLTDPQLQFSTFAPVANEALFFAGGNQWHYRERIARSSKENFCHLLFFHYIPKGCGELVDPGNWHDLFGVPELGVLQSISPRVNENVQKYSACPA